jgi:hypothetical protein
LMALHHIGDRSFKILKIQGNVRGMPAQAHVKIKMRPFTFPCREI